jgi:TolB-like protein
VPDSLTSPASEDVREALEQMLASPDFDGSARARKFLSYVVEEKLGGRQARLKAYSIATSVFGRDANFDPQLDSIVRTAAARLRQSIERYYLLSGHDDRVRISIPRGAYAPCFAVNEDRQAKPMAAIEDVGNGSPAILIQRLTQEGNRSIWPDIANGLTRLIVIDLSRFDGLRVFGPHCEIRTKSFDYVLSGATLVGDTALEADVVLTDTTAGRAIWAASFSGYISPNGVLAFQNEVASNIARTLGEPFGLINSERMHLRRSARSPVPDAHESVLDFFRYWVTFDAAMIDRVRRDLETANRCDPDNAEVAACLSLTCSNMGRLADKIDDDPGLQERASALAERAVRLAPASSWSHYALGLAYWAARDVASSLTALETAVQLNPNNSCITADLGLRYAMLSKWDRARVLIGLAFSSGSVVPSALRMGPFLLAFVHGRFEEALNEARKIPASLRFRLMAIAAAEIRLGNTSEARRAIECLTARDTASAPQLFTELARRNMDEDLNARLMDALSEAGLSATGGPSPVSIWRPHHGDELSASLL